jgi:hypothetical protein
MEKWEILKRKKLKEENKKSKTGNFIKDAK